MYRTVELLCYTPEINFACQLYFSKKVNKNQINENKTNKNSDAQDCKVYLY